MTITFYHFAKILISFCVGKVKVHISYSREILTSALRTLVKNSVKESFYAKRKKKINVLTVFFISHKSDVKTFLKWILNQCLKGTR